MCVAAAVVGAAVCVCTYDVLRGKFARAAAPNLNLWLSFFSSTLDGINLGGCEGSARRGAGFCRRQSGAVAVNSSQASAL